jgi:glycosyltransferase involved in cell wall biosynthesis
MIDEPLVSIVLPTYNGSRYLSQSIQSCLEQTYTNWELIIVDDASTDNSLKIIEQYLLVDNRLKCIRHDTNRKLPAALNTGFNKAKGKYFTWTSDDNCFRPPALEQMVDCLEKNTEAGIVYSDYSIIDDAGKTLSKITVLPPEQLTCGNIVRASFLYRKKIHERLCGYNEELFLLEDFDFWLRASLHFKLTPLHQDLYLFRRHSNSLTTTCSNRIKVGHEKTLVHYLPKMRWAGRKAIALGYLTLAGFCAKRRDLKQTCIYITRSLRHFFSFYVVRASLETFIYALMGERIAALFFAPYRWLKR